MQDRLVKLFWNPEKIAQGADSLCETLPGYCEAKQQYDEIAEKIRSIVGYDLYDEFVTQLMRYSNYEVYSYYFLGLGLQDELTRALKL